MIRGRPLKINPKANKKPKNMRRTQRSRWARIVKQGKCRNKVMRERMKVLSPGVVNRVIDFGLPRIHCICAFEGRIKYLGTALGKIDFSFCCENRKLCSNSVKMRYKSFLSRIPS